MRHLVAHGGLTRQSGITLGRLRTGGILTDPNAILGFGTINAEEVPRLLARVFEAPLGEKSKPSVLNKSPTQQDIPSPQTLSIATATPEVPGLDIHAGAEPSSSGANAAQAD